MQVLLQDLTGEHSLPSSFLPRDNQVLVTCLVVLYPPSVNPRPLTLHGSAEQVANN